MIRTSAPARLLAAGLAALAGFVDAIGYLHLGGFFVSFMSGNSTRFAIGLAGGTAEAARAGGLILTFVLGVVGGSLVGHRAGAHRRSLVLALVCALLAGAAGLGALGFGVSAAVAMAGAMGAENAVFERDDDIPFGVTYMTGALVKTGQRIALALRGGAPFAWAPYALLWAGLVAGAIGGAHLYPWLHLDALWIAVGGMACLALAAARLDAREARAVAR